MSDRPDPRSFYTERLPEQWNRALADQARLADEAPEGSERDAARKDLDGMRAVDATIRVVVQGDGGGEFFLNIASGELAPGDDAAQPPFLTLVQDGHGFARLVEEAGDSALGFLGGISGLAGEMKLTKGRIDTLAGVDGSLRFEVTGDDGFGLLTHFGSGAIPDEPTTTIRVSADAYRALRSGELNPQDAFMGGQIAVEGDMQLAMQIALAAMLPD